MALIQKKHKKGRTGHPCAAGIDKISLEAIIKAVRQECGGRPDIARKAAIHISHRYSGRTLREIGARFGVGESGVARASSSFEAELRGNRLLKEKVNIAIEVLNLSRV